MSRGAVPGLPSPHPLLETLPAIYQEDDLARRLLGALDEVLAPAVSTIDNLAAYLDPALAPDDLLGWLAGWVGISIDETWPMERQRQFVARGVTLHRRRGTARGLVEQLRLLTGGEVAIRESGGVAWSATAGGALPGTPEPSLRIRIEVDRPDALDRARLGDAVTASKPAHVPHEIEVAARTRPAA